jgi:hypothetical protein
MRLDFIRDIAPVAVVSLRRSNPVAFGLKRTSAGFYEYTGRLNVVTPFHHVSGDSHLHRSLGAGPHYGI